MGRVRICIDLEGNELEGGGGVERYVESVGS